MTAAQLSLATGRDQSNLKKLADEMVKEGALRKTAPPPNSLPGRPARAAFVFEDGERERFEALVDEEGDLGLLKLGLQIVVVDADEKMESLSEVLSEADVVRSAVWTAFFDGSQSELLIAYQGEDAVDDSRDLMALLKSAELKARRASVTKVSTSTELAKAERRLKQRVNRSRVRQRVMQENPRERH
jgi:hypothetical protein